MAEIRMQCKVEVADEIGRLAQLTSKIRKAGINIDAACAWVEGGVGHLRIVTPDHDQVCTAITPAASKCEFNEVLFVRIPNRPGALDELAGKLAGGTIDIRTLYATGDETGTATVILETSDNRKALELLNRK